MYLRSQATAERNRPVCIATLTSLPLLQATAERNYHVFYEMLSGRREDAERARNWALPPLAELRVTSQSGCYARRDGVADGETRAGTLAADHHILVILGALNAALTILSQLFPRLNDGVDHGSPVAHLAVRCGRAATLGPENPTREPRQACGGAVETPTCCTLAQLRQVLDTAALPSSRIDADD